MHFTAFMLLGAAAAIPLTSRSPFNLCLYGDNTKPLDQVQAGFKHLYDLDKTPCVVKGDAGFRISRFTGLTQGAIYGFNYKVANQDASSYWWDIWAISSGAYWRFSRDVALAVQYLIDHCTSMNGGTKVVGGLHDANGNGDISVAIGLYDDWGWFFCGC